jgi:cytochrome c-type biogenesis protein CcmF
MEELKYFGETLWIGNVGQFFIVLSFIAAIFSAISYYFSVKNRNDNNLSQSWLKLGRIGFATHGFSVFLVIGLIFYAMVTHRYEYAYVFNHVSDDLPMRYILSAFWEGQEGSFQLWMFWHIILGFVLIFNAKEWEASTMAIVAFVEVFLASMLLGIHFEIGETIHRFGSNPMMLLRDTLDAPIFANADYLSLIKGKGLNPLLQNYWNTIHPPITFLGFASTLIPFAFAVAGLWLRKHNEWLKPALKYALFSGAILGSGILMGALWAYEALSFGGYWAWDPVENAVLVPWIIMVAGIHTNLIANKTNYSIRITYFFYLISFILIVYSTFLTRSGILGDTSAHAFTQMGLEWQLVSFVLAFLIVGIGLFFYRYREIPAPKTEEALSAREFWMFIGSLVLLFSSGLIIAATSLPVYNAIMTYFDAGFVGNVIQDPIEHYNKYQIWIGIFIGILSSVALFLRYKEVNFEGQKSSFFRRVGIWVLLSLLLTFLLTLWIELYAWPYMIMAFVGFFGIVASLDYIFILVKRKLRASASAISHLGFGLMLIGLLTSGLNSSYISTNPFIFKNIFSDEDVGKYVQIIKNKPLYLNGYWVTYESDTLIERMRTYQVDFKKVDENNKLLENFKVYPNAVYSSDYQRIGAFNPDTRHYLDKDIFTCIVELPPAMKDAEKAKEIEDSIKYTSYYGNLGDTIMTESGLNLKLRELVFNPSHPEYKAENYDVGFGIKMEVWNGRLDTTFIIEPATGLNGNLLYSLPESVQDLGLRVNIGGATMDQLLTAEENLQYQTQIIKEGEQVEIFGKKMSLIGFNKDVTSSKSYQKEDGDIAIAAKIQMADEVGASVLEPIFIIRENAPMNIKAYEPKEGIHLRFVSIDPSTQEFTFMIAKDNRNFDNLEIKIAEDVPRNDYLIFEAKIFPGINLFWIGCVSMMIGLFIAWFYKTFKS